MIVREYCDLGSLEVILTRKNRMKEDALREIASCCLLGLDFLHSRRIVSTVSEMAWNDGLERQTMESVHG